MFDPLLEDDPWVKEKVAESKAEGEMKALRKVLIDIVRMRFPSLIELVEAKMAQVAQPEALNVLVVQISAAADEQAARHLLEEFSASSLS